MTKNFSQKPGVGWAQPTNTSMGILGGLSPPYMLMALKSARNFIIVTLGRGGKRNMLMLSGYVVEIAHRGNLRQISSGLHTIAVHSPESVCMVQAITPLPSCIRKGK
jgi:hypothetical protein